MLASCGSDAIDSAASNESDSTASNESESAVSNESESAEDNTPDIKVCYADAYAFAEKQIAGAGQRLISANVTKNDDSYLYYFMSAPLDMSNYCIMVISEHKLEIISTDCGDPYDKQEQWKYIQWYDDPCPPSDKGLDLRGFREFDLSRFELNAIIMIPEIYHTEEDEDGDQVDKLGFPDIVHNDGEERWEIKMSIHNDGDWHMVIENLENEESNVSIEKELHQTQKDTFDFIYNEEGEGFVHYSKVLKTDNTTNSEAAVENMANHHFYCVKMIQGSYVVFRNFETGNFGELDIKQMLIGARGSYEK